MEQQQSTACLPFRPQIAKPYKGINTAAYNASKSAVHQLGRSLAAEWGHPQNTFAYYPAGEPRREIYPPIRVNTISPGHIETALTKEAQETGLVDDWAKQNMLGRISQVEEYRAAVLFLLGDGSSYMTGAVCTNPHHDLFPLSLAANLVPGPSHRWRPLCMVNSPNFLFSLNKRARFNSVSAMP
jgi:NAD(P)-dependent dehydrogenase (short-subunit alcohol dehydrogenase family)